MFLTEEEQARLARYKARYEAWEHLGQLLDNEVDGDMQNIWLEGMRRLRDDSGPAAELARLTEILDALPEHSTFYRTFERKWTQVNAVLQAAEAQGKGKA